MIRDPESQALISTDRTALDKYRADKQRARAIEQLLVDVSVLKTKVADIQSIMHRFMEEK